MKFKLRRSLSLLLALCMLLSWTGVVSAEELPGSQSAVESISVEPITLIEGFSGESADYWDEATGENVKWFCYYELPRKVTIRYQDGSTFTGSPEEIYEKTGYQLGWGSDQSYQNQWGIGTYTATATFMDVSAEFTVNIIENPVESISVEPVTLIAGFDGYSTGYTDETTGEYVDNAWFRYHDGARQVTVHYKSGDTITAAPYELHEETGYWVESYSDQSYENPWGIGTYTATAAFMGVSAEYTVEVIETPVESISIEPITLVEGVDGRYVEDTDETTGETVRWFCYDHFPEAVTIHYKNGDTFTGTSDEIFEETGISFIGNVSQSYNDQWGVGTHTVTTTFMGVSAQYTVEIIGNPVESISVEPLTLVKGSDGYLSGYQDETTGEYVENAWFCYRVEPETVTIHYKGGNTITGMPYEIFEQTGSWVQFDSDQTYENQWDIGTHTATVTFMGVSAQYPVEIIANPVESISVEPITLIENVDVSYEGYWDETTEEFVENAWLCYRTEPKAVTVHYTDGTTFTGTPSEVYEKSGYWVYWESDQTYENQWDIGTHTATVTFMGASAELTVKVVENPVESISVEKLALIEKSDGYNAGYQDETTGEVVENAWFYYEVGPETVTIHYKNGDTLTGNPGEIYRKTGYEVSYNSDQSYETPWGVGTHTATVTFMGVSAEYTVEIVETPVESISVEPLSLIESVHGYQEGYWNETTQEYIENAWFCYRTEPKAVTVRYKDGRTITVKYDDIYEETGYSLVCDSDQTYEKPWGVGTHTATATFMGVSTDFTVVIEESPVEKVEIAKAPNKTEFLTGEYIDLNGAVLRTYYKDGTYEDLSIEWPTVGENLYYPFHNQRLDEYSTLKLSKNHFEEPGTHKIQVSILETPCEYEVTVVESTIEAITVRSDGEDSLVITAKQADGTTFDMNVLAMDVLGEFGEEGGYSEEMVCLLTDRGCFPATFCHPKDGGVYVQAGIGPQGALLKSNTLERCDWIDFHKYLDNYVALLYSANRGTAAYEGTLTKDNIDDLITMAVIIRMNGDAPLEYEERNGKVVFQGAGVKECLQQLFGLTDADLSLSQNYDPTTGEYLMDISDLEPQACIWPLAVSRNNGVIEIQAKTFDGGSIRLLLNGENHQIQALNMSKPDMEKPSDPTDDPTDPTEKPTDPTEKPTDPTEEPTDPTEKPTDPTEEPTDPTEKPTDPTEKPTDPTGKPTDPTGKPDDSEAPSTGDRSMGLPIFLLFASAISLCLLTLKRRDLVR